MSRLVVPGSKRHKKQFEGAQRTIEALYQRGALQSLDGRLPVGRALRQMNADLTAHVGGAPSATEAIVIREICFLALMTGSLEGWILRMAEACRDGACPTVEDRVMSQYRTYSTLLGKGLDRLGMKRSMAKSLDLTEYIRQKENEGDGHN